MENRRIRGQQKEELAAAWLERQGYEILEHNYRCRQGEIDLIARDGRYLVFIEVKYRNSAKCGDPLEAVDRRKQAKILYTASSTWQDAGIHPRHPAGLMWWPYGEMKLQS